MSASIALDNLGIIADLIHLDGAHDFNSVSIDLIHWWRRLRVGGALIGDDYYPDGRWDGVYRAFNSFFTH